MNKIKIEIKNRFTGNILFEYEKENNTIKDTLKKAVEEGADLGDADLGGAYLRGADLGGANLRGADLGGADLGGANLRGADLGDADLGGAYLRGAYLRDADLGDADLGGAYLRGAYLRDADLGGANLRGADLVGAYLYMWDDSEPNIREIIENIETNNSLRIKSHHINKHILSPCYLTYWEYGLIIDEYEIVEPEKKVNLSNGNKVELNPNISVFKYGQGSVRHGDIGTIIDINLDGECHVKFPNHENWRGLEHELIKVETKEMTIKEIEEALGYSVKIVKGSEE